MKPGNGKHVGNNHGLTQAYEIRDLASKHALELAKTPADGLEERAARAQALRNLAMVWDTASERIRIIRGRPLPGSLRPKAKPERRPKRQQAIEPANVVDYAEEKPTSGIQSTEPPQAQASE